MENTPLHSISSVCHPWGTRLLVTEKELHRAATDVAADFSKKMVLNTDKSRVTLDTAMNDFNSDHFKN